MSNTTPVSRCSPLGGSGPATLPGRAAQKEHYTTLSHPCTGGPDPVLLGLSWSSTPRWGDVFLAAVRLAPPACLVVPRGPTVMSTPPGSSAFRGLRDPCRQLLLRASVGRSGATGRVDAAQRWRPSRVACDLSHRRSSGSPAGPVRADGEHNGRPRRGFPLPCDPSNRGLFGDWTSGDATGAELDADARAHGLGRLGDAVLPGALAGPAHHHQVPVTQREPEAPRAPARRAEHERPRRAERDDRDHRVRGAAPADPVAVPGDAVATVPVEAHADRDEVLAQLGAVVAVELRPRLGQQRVRQFLVTPVVPQQARHGDLALVHLPAILPPADVAQQVLQHRVGPGDPAGQVIHPGTATELLSHDPAGQWGERRLLSEIPHRRLVRERHGGTLPGFRTCVRKAVDGALPGTTPSRGGAGALFRRSAPARTAAPPWPRPVAAPAPRRSWSSGSRPGRPRGAPAPTPRRAARAGPHRRRSAPTHPPAGRRCCRPDVRWARRG